MVVENWTGEPHRDALCKPNTTSAPKTCWKCHDSGLSFSLSPSLFRYTFPFPCISSWRAGSRNVFPQSCRSVHSPWKRFSSCSLSSTGVSAASGGSFSCGPAKTFGPCRSGAVAYGLLYFRKIHSEALTHPLHQVSSIPHKATSQTLVMPFQKALKR